MSARRADPSIPGDVLRRIQRDGSIGTLGPYSLDDIAGVRRSYRPGVREHFTDAEYASYLTADGQCLEPVVRWNDPWYGEWGREAGQVEALSLFPRRVKAHLDAGRPDAAEPYRLWLEDQS